MFAEPSQHSISASRKLATDHLRVPVMKSTNATALLLLLTSVAACVKTDSDKKRDSATTSSTSSTSGTREASSAGCSGNSAGLTVPAGFCATIFADTIGHARHVVVGANGTVYVNTWSGRYYQSPAHEGGFLVAMRDTNNDGRADVITRFGGNAPAAAKKFAGAAAAAGPSSEKNGAGGTGIGIYNSYLYAEEGSAIVRYALGTDENAPVAKAEVVVSDLPLSGDHPMHPFVIDASGNLYMSSGSATNSCQVANAHSSRPATSHARSF